MILRTLPYRFRNSYSRLTQMTSSFSTSATNGHSNSTFPGVSLRDLPKSNVFTANLPPDPAYKKPTDSHKAPRDDLGPRMVKGALYTYVRPEATIDPELLGVSQTAFKDVGLATGEQASQEFKDLVAGNRIFWDEGSEEGVYPWAQCYGGRHFCPAFHIQC